MKVLRSFFPLILSLLALSTSAALSPNSVVALPEPPLQIVTCRSDVDVDALLVEHQVQLRSPKDHLRSVKMFFAPLDNATVQRLKADPRVVAVEADGPVALCTQTNSTGIVRMGADQFPVARINGITEPLDVDVAVIDSGIDPHPDLNIYQFYSPFTEDPTDELRHGTSMAGVIGALDNDFGLVGVAPGVRLWNIKYADSTHDSWSYSLGCMNYCYEHADQIAVANMSFVNISNNAPFNSIRNVVRLMVNAGIVVVAAAGNLTNDIAGTDHVFGTGDDFVPAALPESMAVSAVDPTKDIFESYSNFSQVPRTNVTNYVVSPGGAIDVAAPAGNLLMTDTNGGYVIRPGGTSSATAHVTGLVALYIAANGRATNAAGVYAIRQAIVNASLPQSQWNTNNTQDLDANPEPLAIASEVWIPKPVLTNTVSVPGNFQVSFAAVPGYDYTVQSTTNLAAPSAWTNLNSVSGSNFVAAVSVTDTNVVAENFYRLNRKPSP